MTKLASRLKVKNKYDDYEERISFEIVAHKCIDKGCAKPDAIINLLSRFYFTLYYIEDNISYSTKLENPIYTQDAFHSQFQLSADKYRDNNNYL